MSIIQRFYQAFQQRDHRTMGALYHDQGRFQDPVFPGLNAPEARAMWRMLLTSGTDMRMTFEVLEENAEGGHARWEAWYTFGRTGRPVHNRIEARFRFRDGLILEHEDRFSFWRWARQALGPMGLLLGWSPVVRNKVRASARAGLEKAMRS